MTEEEVSVKQFVEVSMYQWKNYYFFWGPKSVRIGFYHSRYWYFPCCLISLIIPGLCISVLKRKKYACNTKKRKEVREEKMLV
jgi:hypothetical protein